MKRTMLTLGVLVMLMQAYGCPIASPGAGMRLDDHEVRSVEPGKTTKRGLLLRFGAPTTIAGLSEILDISVPPEEPLIQDSSQYVMESDALFELFLAGHQLNEYHRIYYYHSITRSDFIVGLFVFDYRGRKTKTDRLWVLVNEQTGLVEDYAFKRFGEHTLFGIKRVESNPLP